MCQIQLHKQAIKFIAKLGGKQQKQIARTLLSLQANPEPQDSKKLQGYSYYRVDIGEYRAIYNWTDTTIFVYL